MNCTLPETDVHWDDVRPYVEKIPQEGYRHASERAMEAFRDMKYCVRIHWGLYTRWNLQQESWPFLKMSNGERQAYQQLYKEFDPTGFDAEEWMRFFERVGLKCFAFTAKHHEGFSLFDTAARVKNRVNWTAPGGPRMEECDLAYGVMDTPFGRDIVRELCDAAHAHGIKIDLYFSHPDWYDADFRPYVFHPLTVPNYKELLTEKEISATGERFDKQAPAMAPALTAEQRERMLARHRAQLTELLTNYGEIDMLCLDMWLGANVWPELRETVTILRGIQPDVMLRARGIGNYGDYYTPEGFLPGNKENTEMPWMVIYPLAQSFSYDPEAGNYKGGAWIIRSLVDAVAKGGNFMVGIGPDKDGRWHPKAVEQLEEAGRWLQVNGEAIYATRARPGSLYKEGEELFFTRSKDSRTVYAICLGWPGRALHLTTVRPVEGSAIRLLGYDGNLTWQYAEGQGLTIDIPDVLQDEKNRPCETAYAFKIEV